MRHLLTLLLLAIPLALLARLLHWPATAVFALSGLAIVPLAKWIGTATEHLAVHVGPSLGGLLNATFGNATELIIALFALRAGLVEVVKASITGSVIGNVLFVLGLALLLGGWGRGAFLEQEVSIVVAALLILSYLLGLLFSLRTHTHLYTAEEAEALHGTIWSRSRSLAVLLAGA